MVFIDDTTIEEAEDLILSYGLSIRSIGDKKSLAASCDAIGCDTIVTHAVAGLPLHGEGIALVQLDIIVANIRARRPKV